MRLREARRGPRAGRRRPSDTDLETYLTSYAATLTAFDAPAAAELWATPGMIVDDNLAGVLEDRETMVDGLQQSCPLYQQLGLASVTHECPEAKELTPAHLAGPRALDLPRRRRHRHD